MTMNRFALITILGCLISIVAVVSIDISQSEVDEVVAIRRSIPQLSKAIPRTKNSVLQKTDSISPNVSSTYP